MSEKLGTSISPIFETLKSDQLISIMNNKEEAKKILRRAFDENAI